MLLQAADNLELKQHNKTNTDGNKTLFIHWTYHPNGLQTKDIREIYNKALQPHINYEKMVIALSRPKNLRDILTRAKLSLPLDFNMQNTIKELKES